MSSVFTPEDAIKRQREMQELLRPFHEASVRVISMAIPRYIFFQGQLKVTYHFRTLRVLAGIRIAARETLRIHGYDLEVSK